ncbi:MAG: rod-binding protein [Leptospirales bacterium]|jgi:Rod binding domain-containing protein
MNPLDQTFSIGGGAHLQRDSAPEILTRAAARANRGPAGESVPALSSTDAKAGEFARYFPGVAAAQMNGRPAPGALTGAPPAVSAGQVSSAQLSQSANIQQEIASDPERKRLYNAALDFQGIFIGKMLKSMRGNLNPENDLLYGGNRQQIFEDMLYDEYSKSMSRSGGFDLADQMYVQLSAKLPPAKASGVRPPGALNLSPVDSAAGRVSTGEVQRSPAVQNPPVDPRDAKARDSYDAHRNRISTEQLWNENDWRP